MRGIVIRWLINAIALWITVQIAALLPGKYLTATDNVATFLVVGAIFGLVNALVRPVVVLLTCPLRILTLGLFTLVINAAMLWLTGWLASYLDVGFVVHGIPGAFLGAIILGVVSAILTLVVRE